MTNCLFAIASARGFAAFYVSPVTLLACIILVPAGVAFAVVSHILKEEEEEEEEEAGAEAEDVNTQLERGILSTRQWYAERYVPCALEWAEIERIPLVKYTCGGAAAADRVEQMMMSSCVVCLAPFREQELVRVLPPCQHAFHANCIDCWFQTHSTCPICRSKVSCPCAKEEDDAADAGDQQHVQSKALAQNASPSDVVCLVDVVVV